jgi:hypothetical protein
MDESSKSVPTLPFSAMTDAEVRTALKEHQIGLTMEEARKIEAMLGRPPTVVEAVIWGIQGSEHCSYKSSRRFLKLLPTEGRHVILGPKEDSGIVALTDGPPGKRWGIVISHESHNHPSQIVPYEGAATGIGGTVVNGQQIWYSSLTQVITQVITIVSGAGTGTLVLSVAPTVPIPNGTTVYAAAMGTADIPLNFNYAPNIGHVFINGALVNY